MAGLLGAQAVGPCLAGRLGCCGGGELAQGQMGGVAVDAA